MSVLLWIPCTPISWKAHAGRGKNSYNPRFKERKEYQQHILSQFTGSPIEDYVSIDFVFYIGIPTSFAKSKKEKAIKGLIYPLRPDVSNLVKFSEDCLKGIVIKDDNIVINISSRKEYSNKVGVCIKVEVLQTT